MSESKFIRVLLSEWDNSKLELEMKDENLNFTYDGLIPLLKVHGTEEEDFLLVCPDGLKEKKEHDGSKFTEQWSGDWEFSFKLADNLSKLKPPTDGEEDKRSEADKLRCKLVEILEYMKAMVKDATEETCLDCVSYKKTYTTNKLGKKTPSGNDPNGYVYLTAKVGHTAEEDAPKAKNSKGRLVFENSHRIPKPKMYDLSRAEGDELLEFNPGEQPKQAMVPMRANPTFTFSVNKSPKGWSAPQRHVNSVFFKPDESVKPKRGNSDLADMRKRLYNKKQLMEEIPE